MAGRPWFRPRRFGWGLAPASWEGWALTGAYVLAVFVLARTLATAQPWIFWTLLAFAALAYFLVANLKR
jgi:hypothetical protein